MTTPQASWGSHPAVDSLTARAMVVLQDRPVVAFTKWLADGLRVCSETGRGLQIVTSGTSRLTMPLRLVLTGPNSRWVVRADGAYYDGLSGVPLVWDGEAFAQAPDARAHAPAFTTPPTEPIGAQLTVTFRVRHPESAPIGAALEQLCLSLTGEPPAGWGTAEPAAELWSQDDLGQHFRSRGSGPAWLTVVGGGARTGVGTMLLSPAGGVVEEAITLVVGYANAREAPVASLPTLVGAMTLEHTLVSLFAQLSPGRADLTTAPRWVGPPAPIGMAVSGSTPGPPGIQGQQIGDMQSPTVWYLLGDGRQQEGWQRYEQLSRHLKAHLT